MKDDCTDQFELGYDVGGSDGSFGVHAGCSNSTATDSSLIEDNGTYYIMTTKLTADEVAPNNVEIYRNGVKQDVNGNGFPS